MWQDLRINIFISVKLKPGQMIHLLQLLAQRTKSDEGQRTSCCEESMQRLDAVNEVPNECRAHQAFASAGNDLRLIYRHKSVDWLRDI